MLVINVLENQLNEDYKEKLFNPSAQRKYNIMYIGDK